MKAVIIDDERLARTELRKLLSEYPEIEVVDEASNAEEGIQKIENHNPDLIFLDIQMPGKTGFDMLSELDHAPQVIFTTAYDEYALKAFEVNALDYLLKPVEPKRLADAVEKLRKSGAPTSNGERVYQGGENNSILNENDQVFVKDGDRWEK
jgi:two-component system, LytTR family, response regulator